MLDFLWREPSRCPSRPQQRSQHFTADYCVCPAPSCVWRITDFPRISNSPHTPQNGKLEMQAVSWKLVKKLAEPDAGLTGRKVTVLNPSDKSVVATKTTDSSGIVDFDLPAGNYTLLGASDEPQSVQIQSGQTTNFKIVMH